MKLNQAVKIAQMRLRRWDSTRYYGINLQTRTWCWINVAKDEYRGDVFADPTLTEAVIMKLRRDTKKYEVMEWYEHKILINKYNVVKDYKPRGKLWFSKDKPTVQKCNSRRKKAKAITKARKDKQKRRELLTYIRENDPHGINSISNSVFGHPKRMKAFNLQDKTNERNERAHKERNIPPLSDD